MQARWYIRSDNLEDLRDDTESALTWLWLHPDFLWRWVQRRDDVLRAVHDGGPLIGTYDDVTPVAEGHELGCTSRTSLD